MTVAARSAGAPRRVRERVRVWSVMFFMKLKIMFSSANRKL
jgi:hypothetical protein